MNERDRSAWWSAAVRRPRVAAALASVVVLALALRAIDPLPVGVMYDDGMYVILAKSLATGQGYRWLNLPGAPPATHFPPGYPALLSLLWRAFPSFPANVLAFKALNAVLLALAAVGLVLFACRRLRFAPGVAALVAVVGCAAVPTLVLSTVVMSETLFLTVLVLLLPFADRIVDAPRRDWETILLGALVGALTMVRTQGIALAAAIVIALAMHRRWRDLATFAGAFALCIAPWQVWQSAHREAVPIAMRGSYGSYGGWLAHGFGLGGAALGARTLARTGAALFGNVVVMAGAGLPIVARAIAAFGAVLLFGLGMARLRRRSVVAFLFLCAYLGIVLLWPFAPARFVWGIWPVLTMVVALGVAVVWGWRPNTIWLQAARAGGAVVALAVVWGYATYTVRGYRGRWWSSIPRQAGAITRPLVRWTVQHTKPNEVVASNAEPLVYLYTGRPSVPVASLSIDEYFAPPSVATRVGVLRSILQAYPVETVVVMANDSVSAAARTLSGGPTPELVLRDSIPNGVVFARSPTFR